MSKSTPPADDAIAASERTVISSQPEYFEVWLTRAITSTDAQRMAPQIGEVRRTDDGRWILVLTRTIEFKDEMWMMDHAPHADPCWICGVTGVPVAPNEAERQVDARHAAAAADAQEIAEVMAGASRTAVSPGPFTPFTFEGECIRAQGRGIVFDFGDHVRYQPMPTHEGFLSGEITDPALIRRIRAIIAGGPRTRQHGRTTYIIRTGKGTDHDGR